MAEVKLNASARNEFGKGAARRLRVAHLVPAVLYGHGTDPVHVALPGHETMLALKQANALLSIDLDGKSQLALPKDVQRNPIKGTIEHVDLLIVRKGEKVTVEVQLVLTGEAAPGTLVQIELNTLSVEVEATHIPQSLELSIEGAQIGTQFSAGEIELPKGAVLITDPEALAVLISDAQRAGADADAEDAEAAEAAEAAGEGGDAPAEDAADES